MLTGIESKSKTAEDQGTPENIRKNYLKSRGISPHQDDNKSILRGERNDNLLHSEQEYNRRDDARLRSKTPDGYVKTGRGTLIPKVVAGQYLDRYVTSPMYGEEQLQSKGNDNARYQVVQIAHGDTKENNLKNEHTIEVRHQIGENEWNSGSTACPKCTVNGIKRINDLTMKTTTCERKSRRWDKTEVEKAHPETMNRIHSETMVLQTIDLQKSHTQMAEQNFLVKLDNNTSRGKNIRFNTQNL